MSLELYLELLAIFSVTSLTLKFFYFNYQDVFIVRWLEYNLICFLLSNQSDKTVGDTLLLSHEVQKGIPYTLSEGSLHVSGSILSPRLVQLFKS